MALALTCLIFQIADFGFASYKSWSQLSREEIGRQKQINSICQNIGGTLSYMAPEHLSSIHLKPGEKSDVYSFGIVMWAIFANKEPYERKLLPKWYYHKIKLQMLSIKGYKIKISRLNHLCPKTVPVLHHMASKRH